MQIKKVATNIFSQYRKVLTARDRFYLKARYKLCPYCELLDSYIPTKGRIIDWGCGFGFFSFLLKYSQPEREMFCIEIDTRKIKAIHDVQNIIQEQININHLNNAYFEPHSINSILLLEVSYYLSDETFVELLLYFKNLLNDNSSIVIISIIKDKLIWKNIAIYMQEFISVKILKQTKAETLKIRTNEENVNIFNITDYHISYSKNINSFLPYTHMLYILKR